MSLCQCGCPEVSLAWADCLTLIACVRVPVPLPCSVSAVCLRCRAIGREWGFAGSCYCIPAPPKVWTLRFFCVPSMLLFFCFFFIPNCNLILASYSFFFFTTVRDVWRADCGCLLKAGCSLKLLLGPISAPEGLLNCPRFSVIGEGEERTGRRGVQ